MSERVGEWVDALRPFVRARLCGYIRGRVCIQECVYVRGACPCPRGRRGAERPPRARTSVSGGTHRRTPTHGRVRINTYVRADAAARGSPARPNC